MGPLKVVGGAPTVIYPHQHIRMDYMDVTMRLKKATYRVDGVFHFFNTGDTVTEWVGFLQRGDMGYFMRYDAWVDGRKANVLEEALRDQRKLQYPPGPFYLIKRRLMRFFRVLPEPSARNMWLMQQVTFPSNRRATVRMSYEATYMRYDKEPTATYEYGTGGYWKDGIGVAAITIDGSEIGGVKNFSLSVIPGWRRLLTENVLRLETTNYKPGPDEQLTVHLTHK